MNRRRPVAALRAALSATIAATLTAALAALALAAPARADDAGAIAVRDDRGVEHRFAAPVMRIVTLAPALTETVCLLGACERLAGVDRASNWPQSVQALPRLGGLEDTAIERVVALRPQVVLAPASVRAVARLESLGLKVVTLEPRTLADTRRTLHTVAALLGDAPAGERLWQQLDARVSAAAARVPPALRGRSVYFEVASAPYAASESSFVGELLARLGTPSAVPGALGPFPQLNPEWVVRTQPGIVMATAQALAQMPARPGWSRLQALAEGRRCGFDAARWDPMVRAGPRLAEAAEHLADCLASLAARR